MGFCSGSQRLDALTDGYSLAPPDGGEWERGVMEKAVCVYMPGCQAVTVTLSGPHTVMEVLNSACRVRRPYTLHSPCDYRLIWDFLNIISWIFSLMDVLLFFFFVYN